MIIPLEWPPVTHDARGYAGPAPGARDHGVHPTLILAVISLAGLSYSILSSAVIPALTTIQHDLHTTETGVTWLLTGYLLSASVGTSILGPPARAIVAAFFTWRFVPESPVRVPGRLNWLAAGLMTAGFCCVLIAVSETISWGWGSARTLGLLASGVILCIVWIVVELRSREPLIDMAMMRIRGVWSTNLVAFLLGAGMYASFLVYPQLAQLPKRTGFGFGASVVTAGLYLLPAALGMSLLGTFAGRVARRFGSKLALIVGSAVTALAFGWLAVAHAHPYDMLISAALRCSGSAWPSPRWAT